MCSHLNDASFQSPVFFPEQPFDRLHNDTFLSSRTHVYIPEQKLSLHVFLIYGVTQKGFGDLDQSRVELSGGLGSPKSENQQNPFWVAP